VVERPANTVSRVPVTLGRTLGARVEILDGLKNGDEVVIKGIHSLEPGQSVAPRGPQ